MKIHKNALLFIVLSTCFFTGCGSSDPDDPNSYNKIAGPLSHLGNTISNLEKTADELINVYKKIQICDRQLLLM
jgi:hypothetical protein